MGNDIINMMKFFALVALTVFATANASTVASVTASRTSEITGTDGGNLVLVITAGAGVVADTTGTIAVAVTGGGLFSDDGDTSCTATVAGVTPAPNFKSTETGNAANKGVVTNQGTATETITFTMGTATSDTLAANGVITITCTDNLVAKNAATVTTYTFSATTSGDITAATGTYALTETSSTAFTASRGTGATNLMTGMPGGDLTFSSTPPTFTTKTVSGASGSQVLTLTLDSANTAIVAATKAATIVCTDNLANNPAAGAVTFNFATGTDTSALAAQTGYTIGAKKVTAFTAARATSLVTGVAGGDLTFTFTPTTAIAADGPATITATETLYTATGAATTCATTVTGGGTAPTSTTTVASSGTGVTGNNVLVLTFVGNGVNAGSVAIVVCSADLAVNGAAGAVTFGIRTDAADGTALDSEATAQTGYTITAATSAASSTASVSMLTMLALAAVAMRQ